MGPDSAGDVIERMGDKVALIRSVLYLKPKHGRHDAIVDYYRRRGVLDRALQQDGCLGAELQIPIVRPGPALVTALWRDENAYEDWVADPSRAADAHELGNVLNGGLQPSARGALYRLVFAGEKAAG